MGKLWHCAMLLSAAAILTYAGRTNAIDWGEEYAKRIKATENVSPLGDDMFGDSINLFNGTVSFSVIDISIPGNSALPVTLTRTYDTQDVSSLRPVGVWDIEAPHLHAVHPDRPSLGYWAPLQRCSTVAAPPDYGTYPTAFTARDYWSGTQLRGTGGDGDLLAIAADQKLVRPTAAGNYLWVNKSQWFFTCLPALQSGLGEGFVGHAPDGTNYTFNWMVVREYPGISRKDPSQINAISVNRKSVRLYATEVMDRFGNWVRYDWTGGRLNRIYSNDGREISLAYVNDQLSTAKAKSVGDASPANQRTWTYEYTGSALSSVLNPDGSRWRYASQGPGSLNHIDYQQDPTNPGGYVRDDDLYCWPTHAMLGKAAGFTITSPSGAVAQYNFAPTRHGRANVNFRCMSGTDDDYRSDYNDFAITHDVMSLQSKAVSGLGLPTQSYIYGYTSLEGGYRQVNTQTDEITGATAPPHYKYVTVTETDGTQQVHTFGKDYSLNEGQLLRVETRKNGQTYKIVDNAYIAEAAALNQLFPASMGSNLVIMGDQFSAGSFRPSVSTRITLPLQGVSFFSDIATDCSAPGIYCFDAMARSRSVQKYSSGLAASYSKTDNIVYYDDLSKWVLGQVASSATNAITVSSTTFDAATALPLKTYAFGKLQQTLTYNTDGTLASVSDGRDASVDTTIHLSGWKRGVPQQIQYPATTDLPVVYQKAGVDDNGWIDWVTDENGYKTCYEQDAMGRLSKITHPDEASPTTCSTARWAATTISFADGNAAARGVPAGHWRQIVTTGNSRRVLLFDALWRPLVEQAYDLANLDATLSEVAKRYDSSGRLVFQSYALPLLGSYADATLKGARTEYDALDRVTAVRQDSDGGTVLSTTTSYQAGFKTAVTNPRNKVTTTTYMAYDQPGLDWPVAITHPAGAYTDIVRDVFGKPLSVKRRNATSSEVLTRQYVYRPDWQTLCKVIEPETGTTVMDYDEAGNLAWLSSGLNLPATNNCNLAEGYNTNSRAHRSYDARNRLKALTFIGGNGDQDWSYWRDGLPSQASTWNIPGAGIEPKETVNTYVYNARRLLTDETVAHPAWYTYALHYDYSANGHFSGQSYPSGHSVSYAPNALGQPTQVTSISAGVTYASGIDYYPNGAVHEFTYGNGILHTMQQNQRQLPARSTDSKPGLTALDFGYAFDANGNLGTITDYAQAGRQNRSMVYDDLDRLTQVTSSMFGADPVATYAYNTLDNLQRAKIAGRVTYYCYNAKNQLAFLRTGPVCTGAASPTHTALAYDDQGNLAGKNNTAFGFDTGNLLREVSTGGAAIERYRYDAHGRRTLASRLSGPSDTLGVIFSQYANSGQLMYQENQRPGVNKEIDQIYLAGSLIAQREVSLASGAAVVKYLHTDALGSPVAVTYQTGTAIDRTEYEPYGKVLSPAVAKDGPGYTGHVLDAATGMNYMQQRYYDPTIGRFLSVDPVAANANTGASFNRYAYANNNPYRFTDPDGRNAVTAFGGLIYETGQALQGNGFDGQSVMGALADGYNGEGDGFASAVVQDATTFVPAGAVAGAAIKLSRLASQAAKVANVAKAADKAVPSLKTIGKIENQLKTDGLKSVLKSQQKLERRLSEHTEKLGQIKEAGGHTSSVQREITGFKKELNAIKEVLEKNK